MSCLLPSPFVRSALHGDRTILLDLRRERYYGLDAVGTRVWALVEQGADVSAIVTRLGEEFDAPRQRLETDVGEVLRCLTGLGVIGPAQAPRGDKHLGTMARNKASGAPSGPLREPSGLVCTLTLIGTTLALRLVGLRRSLAVARALSRSVPAAVRPSLAFLASVVRKVDTAAAFFPGRALCLEQSMALYLCLRRAGVPVELRIGVQPYPFAAHAWVEHEGKPVGESQERVDKFVPFRDLEVF